MAMAAKHQYNESVAGVKYQRRLMAAHQPPAQRSAYPSVAIMARSYQQYQRK
jgi:hypothetical protein